MKRYTLIAGIFALWSLGAATVQAADEMTTYTARNGSRMRIEGTANIIHPTWQIESPFIRGMMKIGPGFPTEPGQKASLGKVSAEADAIIQVRSLKSVKEDGTHYDERMDEVTYEHLKESQFKQIFYHLTELTLKELPKTNGGAFTFDSKGDLTISGVTNKISMIVYITPTVYTNSATASTEKQLEIKGSIPVKMTDYKVAPVDINLVLGHIKTGDEVKLVFTWILRPKKETASTQ
jgi:hypothetical protein